MTATVDRAVGAFLDALGARLPAPAAGSGAAVAGAIAAGLAELAARVSDEEEAAAEAESLRRRLAELADEDAEVYAAFLRTRSNEDRQRTIEVPEELAAVATRVAGLARGLATTGKRSVRGDAEAAVAMAEAVARVGARLAAINRGAEDSSAPRA